MREIPDEDINEGVSLAAEGWHHVEVRDCQEKRSARGDSYYNLELVGAETKTHVAYDVAMLEGKGNGMGIKKLSVLGAAQRNEAGNGWVIKPTEQIVGLRAWAHMHHDHYEWEGEKRTRCKVSLKEGEVGYRTEEDAPTEGLADDIPF